MPGVHRVPHPRGQEQEQGVSRTLRADLQSCPRRTRSQYLRPARAARASLNHSDAFQSAILTCIVSAIWRQTVSLTLSRIKRAGAVPRSQSASLLACIDNSCRRHDWTDRIGLELRVGGLGVAGEHSSFTLCISPIHRCVLSTLAHRPRRTACLTCLPVISCGPSMPYPSLWATTGFSARL